MQPNPTFETRELQIGDERHPVSEEKRHGKWSYRMKLGRETIWLSTVEYRILAFLSATPCRAYSRQRIAEAISIGRLSVEEEALDGHIASLREKLGFFADYIQSVPYVGYRFKA